MLSVEYILTIPGTCAESLSRLLYLLLDRPFDKQKIRRLPIHSVINTTAKATYSITKCVCMCTWLLLVEDSFLLLSPIKDVSVVVELAGLELSDVSAITFGFNLYIYSLGDGLCTLVIPVTRSGRGFVSESKRGGSTNIQVLKTVHIHV